MFSILPRLRLLKVGLVVLVVVATANCYAGDKRDARVALDSTTIDYSKSHHYYKSIWKQEVMRQAFLLAAHAELLLPVADATVGDHIALDDSDAFEISFTDEVTKALQVSRGPRRDRKLLQRIELSALDSTMHREWIDEMEKLSRNEFATLLTANGFARKKAPFSKRPSALLDPALVRMIDAGLTLESQFFAIRQLHRQINEDGETRARMAGLVRAYANLGILTENFFGPLPQAIKARSLLFAQRWVARDPRSPLAVQHRAYAFALVGMHGEALRDLQTAAELTPIYSQQVDSPAWLPLIEAYCKYDWDKLNALRSDEEQKQLASLLCFMAYEQEGSADRTVKLGLTVAEDLPGCYKLFDSLSAMTGPGAGQVFTQAGPAYLAANLLPELDEKAELPKSAHAIIAEARAAGAFPTEDADEPDPEVEIAHRVRLIDSLRQPPATEAGLPAPEPDAVVASWPMLAQIIEETSFLQVFRRTYFLRKQLGVPVEGYLDVYQPVIAGHRLAPLLDIYRLRADVPKLRKALQDYDRRLHTFAISRLTEDWPKEFEKDLFSPAIQNLETLPNELAVLPRYYGDYLVGTQGELIDVSPHSPYAMMKVLRGQPDRRHPNEAAWVLIAEQSPTLARAFASAYEHRGEPEKAQSFSELAFKLDPSQKNAKDLATRYKNNGDDAKWLKTLDAYLETPSLGLEHAQVQVEIANYYIGRREWDKALPYANEAAQTGAQWAFQTAREVNEANHLFEDAEKGYLLSAARYGENPLEWYFFCRRNGCGRLEQAREFVMPDGAEALADSQEPTHQIVSVLLFENKPRKAYEVLDKLWQNEPSCYTAIRAALLADDLDDATNRDLMLTRVCEQKETPSTPTNERPLRAELVELSRMFQADLAKEGKAEFDFAAIDALRSQAPEGHRCSFNYFVACYLAKHGNEPRAIDYWKQCMSFPKLMVVPRTAAGYELHKRGIQPSEWKELLFAKPEAPTATEAPPVESQKP